ncbi:hypothetical protein BV97_04882 [Novosphingobium resinovorum]|uniref:DUF4440 domain-containing protein n=1 Tax=Novosphingobium resinovorum TaxID=158500 RepID=A0A031JIF0_9SPHN|nr:hypothetical protein [Novosphingobium resinovorum]EZP73889.1 hypothetical protein BV97_04882 [Novosphingobium resinovorum]
MKRIALGLALVAVFAASAQTDARPRRRLPPGTGTANPSALVAEEIAFARLAREKGQWKAFREFADDTAIMFVPQEVQAQDWLKKQADPAAPVQWEPHQVWMSCDGTLGVTKGAWQRPDGSVGWYTTIWQRQKKGEYRWVLDHGDTLPSALPEPDMLTARVAKCGRRPDAPPPGTPPADARTFTGGNSLDGTLRWHVTVMSANDARTVSVQLWNGTQFDTIVEDKVTPQG